MEGVGAIAGAGAENSGRQERQTFSLDIDGRSSLPEGDFHFRDHTRDNRVNNRPLQFELVAWETFAPETEGCDHAGVEATGVLRVENTGEEREFTLRACDTGQPGSKAPHNWLGLDVYEDERGGPIWYHAEGLLTGGNLRTHADDPPEEEPEPEPEPGDLVVHTETTGEDLPEDYTVTISGEPGTAPRSIGPNDTEAWEDVPAGDYEVELGDVTENCSVSDANPRTVTVPDGGEGSTTFEVSCEATATAAFSGNPSMETGTTGSGSAEPEEDRQEFEFATTDDPDGTLFYRDYSIVRGDGSIGRLSAAPSTDASTGITSFTQTSLACVTFEGVGRVDYGELADFTIEACDNDSPGVDSDTFHIKVPAYSYSRSGTLTEGDISLVRESSG